MEIKKVIESGLMETFVMGVATEAEIQQVLQYKKEYPEFKEALESLEFDMELMAQHMGIAPPAGTLEKIESEIKEIQRQNQAVNKVAEPAFKYINDQEGNKQERYIEVESESNQMRVNKAWKWVFLAVFALGKIFLACAIYFYLENRQAQEKIEELKTELKQHIK